MHNLILENCFRETNTCCYTTYLFPHYWRLFKLWFYINRWPKNDGNWFYIFIYIYTCICIYLRSLQIVSVVNSAFLIKYFLCRQVCHDWLKQYSSELPDFFVCNYSSSHMCSASVPWDKFYLNGHDVTNIDEMLHILTYICIRCTWPQAVKFHLNISINVHPKNFECQLSSSLNVEYFSIFAFQWCMLTFYFLGCYIHV